MPIPLRKSFFRKSVFCSALALGLAAGSVQAQSSLTTPLPPGYSPVPYLPAYQPGCCPAPSLPTSPPFQLPAVPPPAAAPAPGSTPTPRTPSTETTPRTPSTETTPRTPGTETTPRTPGAETTPSQQGAQAGQQAQGAGDTGAGAGAAPSFGGEAGAAGLGGAVAIADPGYIDSAVPKNTIRLRYDSAWDMNRPDRALFFYGAWQELSFHPHAITGGGVFFDPRARGPEQLPNHLNFQQPSAYLEFAWNNLVSVFAEVPFRIVHFGSIQEDLRSELGPNGKPLFPEPRSENTESQNQNSGGLSDINIGAKVVLFTDGTQYLTFQWRTYLRTGDPALGLGTGHVSLEPGLLMNKFLTDRLIVFGQILDWIPVSTGPEAGNVLTYGLGAGYTVYQRDQFRIIPITEFVGWSILHGFASTFGPINVLAPPGLLLPTTHGVENVGGETIINAKVGVRTYFGNGSDMYLGWGHSLTEDRWYRNIFRAEYRFIW